jgi:hypothetical protein
MATFAGRYPRAFIVLNGVAVWGLWFLVVAEASAARPLTGIAAVAAWVAIHAILSGQAIREITAVISIGTYGWLVDSTLVWTDRIVFDEASGLFAGSPLWMTALWWNIATALGYSLAWLRSMPLAALLGAIAGPISYQAGASMGALSIGEPPWASLAAVSVAWAVSMPAIIAIRRLIEDLVPPIGSDPPSSQRP